MKRLSGIIFSNIYDGALGELTAKRTVASLPFGGRYRQIDFVLSNMVNSNISSVGVITKYNYESLMDHLGSCDEWDLNHKKGGLYIIPPFAFGRSDVYHGKLEALHTLLFVISITVRFLPIISNRARILLLSPLNPVVAQIIIRQFLKWVMTVTSKQLWLIVPRAKIPWWA